MRNANLWGVRAALALALGGAILFPGDRAPARLAWAGEEPAPAEEAPAGPAERLEALEAQVAAHARENDEAALTEDIEGVMELWDDLKADDDLARRGLALLGTILRAGRDPATEVAALRALGATQDARAAPHIKPHLRQADRKRTDLVLEAAIDAAGQAVDDALVEPLLGLVEDSRHAGVGARAVQSLGAYHSCRKKRAKILERVVKVVERLKPGGPPRARGGGDPMDPTGTSGGEGLPPGQEGGPQDRWVALVKVLPEAMSRLTGRKLAAAEDWFLLVKERKGRLEAIFVDEER